MLRKTIYTNLSGSLCAAVLMAAFIAYEMAFNRRVFFITEGWWEYYANLLNSGLDPYVVDGLKITPLHGMIIAFIREHVTNDFVLMRDIYSAVHLAQVLLIFYWARFHAPFSASIFGVTLATLAVVQGDAFISKDYHTTLALFQSAVLVGSATRDAAFSKARIIMAGLFCALMFLTKQNVGLFVAAAFALVIFLDRHEERYPQTVLHVLIFVATFVSALIISLIFGPNWTYAFIGNDAKGGLVKIMLRFISDPFARKVGSAAVLIVFSAYILKANFVAFRTGAWWAINSIAPKGTALFGIHRFVEAATYEQALKAGFLLVALVSYIFLPQLVLAIALAWPAVRWILHGRSRASIRTGVILYTIAYCGTQTAGYNAISLEPLIVLMFSELWPKRLPFTTSMRLENAVLGAFLLTTACSQLSNKILNEGYSWWGLKAGGILNATQELKSSALRRMRTDSQTAEMLEAVSFVGKQLSGTDRVFAYPSIPIVYELLKRTAPTNGVLWFDAASETDGKTAVAKLDQRLPEYVFWLRPPSYVYEGHSLLRGRSAAMNVVDTWLMEKLRDGQYVVQKSILSYSKLIEQVDASMQTLPVQINLTIWNDARGLAAFNSNKPETIKKDWRISDDVTELRFKNTAILKLFMEQMPVLMDVDEYVFYVLRRKESH